MTAFSFRQNRSERALQIELLAPALADKSKRGALLTLLKPTRSVAIAEEEGDAASAMHFVWVLRDAFYAEREVAVSNAKNGDIHAIPALRQRWCEILGLDAWATDADYWSRNTGNSKLPRDFPFHPCHRSVGWTKPALADHLTGEKADPARIDKLIECRKAMNTECDCLVQTPKRLIVFECKGETSYLTEQRERQRRLFKAMTILLRRELPLLYVELSWHHKSGDNSCWQPWAKHPDDGFECLSLRWVEVDARASEFRPMAVQLENDVDVGRKNGA